MERFNRANLESDQPSRVSSVSSLDSAEDSVHSNYNGTSKHIPKRSVSLMPSYMKHVPIARKPVASNGAPGDAPRTSEGTSSKQDMPLNLRPKATGTLLLAIAALPSRSIIFYLQSMLQKLPYKEICILGNSELEAELKKLKVDIYALLGKIGQEVGVRLGMCRNWEDVELDSAISKAVEEGDAIHGVLCCPSYDSSSSYQTDIMSFDQDQLEKPWKSSVGFLHIVAKYALPSFRSVGHEHRQPGMFLVTSPTEKSPISTLYNAGCRTLMTLLVEANAGKGLTIDYAENVFLPQAEPAKSNGRPTLTGLDLSRVPQPEEYPPPESPTKLWALYNELGAAD